ncbi:terminal uridylyltransferase 4-like isoform X1, partial [Paramuricea clavata]
GLTCRVTSGNSFALCINSLLKIYGELDSRVRPLCHCFRLWAKICEVDRQTTGTLPPYSFFLMVIHYLQQIESPVLPVLHEKFGDELNKYLEEEDYGLLALIRKGWKTGNKTSLGELWLGLLRFYSDYENNEIYVVSIRQKRRLKRSEKSSWGKKKFAIEDPFSTKRNVARTVLKNNVYRYIIEHLRVALVYFSCHPNSSGTRLNENKGNDPDEHKGQKNVQESHVSKRENRPHSSTEEDVEVASSDSDEDEQGNEDDDEAGDEDGDEDGDRSETEDLIDGIFAIDSINDSVLSDNDGADTTATDQSVLEDSDCATSTTTIRSGLIIAHSILPGDSATSSEQLDVEWRNAEYRFDDSVLRKGDAPETKCTYCGEEGHIVENCTAEQVTRTTKPLPPMPDWFKDILSKVCYCCKDDFGMTNDEIRRRQFYLKTLETYIKDYLPDARLHLFGSSCNGFGFTGSDIDLCMTLDGKAKNDIDCIEHIKKLANVLRKYSQCTDIVAITGAKVPIVKFFLRHAKVEADISMYNEVALMNTKLLATYVHIDQRVQILGCTLKIFVKLCDIGDASKGSLSSYAYILMLLHYLQQRRPPVLPVLQELYDTPEQPQSVVEGHNCWFYDDLKNLGTKWKARNTESCGELWLGFLRYYTEEFDYRRNVVCVRYLKPLTKFEKLWNGRQICIEDPFVLTHNLGAALTLNMVRFIRSTFERARERFGTARPDIPANGQDRQRFFFDTYFLTNGFMPPTDRNCNVCGKIGHWAKECPYNKSRRKKGEQNKAEKGQQNKAEKDQQSKTDKGRQSKDEKIPPDKIPPEKIPPEKIPQNIGEQGKQNSVEKGSQNQDKNIPINWAARIQANSTEKAQERQQEEMTKSNLEGNNDVI